MPELPEVETIRRGLIKYLVKKPILKVEVFEPKMFIGGSAADNFGGLLGALITDVKRYGKCLVVELDNGLSVMIHLRMTGQLIWRGKDKFAAGHPSENFVAELPNKQTRIVLEIGEGRLFFNDQRKFGFFKVVKTEDVLKDSFIKKLAKEPWQMTTEELFEKLKRHAKTPIKGVILDQSIIAGLGNIYADEALFYAAIHPERRAGTISEKECEKLLEGARTVMERSIEAGGSTMATYVNADGSRGNYLDKFAQVFGRTGEPCFRCGEKIVKIRVAGRGTHICPKCQQIDNRGRND
ncbi:bifunctional DNA-formamidopyrimidine glycosylase/DNA-(apurinic or apyrimidinic site) lyase [Candidatus Saccharibacteria bacterium]|nr:bifunctional DNA-formamidopyrimidine glycosylase/DNA-(apurinic or apyrimidinic site) lyase [Candidatus Saccharibacteria bacterium]